ncbi:PAS domain S-box protein [Caballeronia sp. GAFFF1]|uniref:PAS domain S-box protein n=1 Tax=Caballeronia sp. GAFFF1 TaxID=2921779 RepID=UPI002027BB03|nr:PAS domain S-box protein [Caballeronia sp. GAFFF1]
MLSAPLSDNEPARLRLLRSLAVLDTAPEEAFDRVTRLVAQILQVPIALVSLVDEHRQWFKSRVGLEVCETSREIAFCSHVVSENAMLVVEDTLTDPRFADNPLVTGAPFVRFYAGVPLRSSEGLVLGTLCAIDAAPRSISKPQREALVDLAAIVERELIQRETIRDTRRVQQLDRRNLLVSEARFATIFQKTPTGKAIVDLKGRFLDVNPKLCEITGYTADALMRMTFADITVPEDLAPDLQRVTDLLAGRIQTYSLEKRYRRPDGSVVWVDLTVALVRDNQQRPLHFISVVQDISSRKRSEQFLRDYQSELENRVIQRTSELASSRAALQTIADNLPVLIAHVDSDLRYTFNNEVYRQVFGVDPAEVKGKRLSDILDRELFAELKPCFDGALAGNRTTHDNVRYDRTKDRVWSSTYIPDIRENRVVGFYVMSQDVTERKRAEHAMREEAMRDALTGLPNRRALHRHLDEVLNDAHYRGVPFATFFLDLDGFKKVNDSYGHDAGDEVLKEVAVRLRRVVRSCDTVTRLAGDEFVIISRGTSTTDACSRIAQDICRSVGRPFSFNGSSLRLGTSVGIAMCTGWERSTGELILGRADAAMYEAKRKGRNGFRFASNFESGADDNGSVKPRSGSIDNEQLF